MLIKPLEDLFLGNQNLEAGRQFAKDNDFDKGSGLRGLSQFLNEGFAFLSGDVTAQAKAPIRITVAALGALAVFHYGLSGAAVAALGATISLPATLIGVGGYIAYQGLAAVIASLATGILSDLGAGLLLLGAGYMTLECYRIFPLGLLELQIADWGAKNSLFYNN